MSLDYRVLLVSAYDTLPWIFFSLLQFVYLVNSVPTFGFPALGEANWILGGPSGAAFKLGMKRTTLQSKMRKLGIARP